MCIMTMDQWLISRLEVNQIKCLVKMFKEVYDSVLISF